MSEYITHRVSEENYKDVCYLFRERGLHYSLDFVRRKFDTSFTGKKNIGFLAYNPASGEPAAHYSVFPCFLSVGGKKILAAQSGDTITHKRHQHKGLFLLLAEMTFDLCRSEKIEIVYGFPNQNSYHGLVNKLNFTHVESFASFTIPVKAFPLQRVMRRLNAVNIYHFLIRKRMKMSNMNCDQPPASVLQENFGGVLHNQDFRSYKTYSTNYVVRIDNVIIWFKAENGLLIGDVMAEKEFNGNKILNAMRKLAIRTGCTQISLLLSPGTKLYQYLSEKFQSTKSAAICWLNITTNFKAGDLKFSTADTDTF